MRKCWGALVVVSLAALCVACGNEQGPSALDDRATVVLEKLVGFDAAASKEATATLVEIGPPVAAGLGALLDHDEIPIRRAAARTLRELGYRAAPATRALAAALSDPDREVRRDAGRALREIGSAAAPAFVTIWKRLEEARWALEAELRRVSRPNQGGADLETVWTFARLDDACRRVSNRTALPRTNDPVIDGHPVSHWVNRWMVRREGRAETEQRLARLPAEQVVPHVLPWSRMSVWRRRMRSRWGAPPPAWCPARATCAAPRGRRAALRPSPRGRRRAL